MNKQKPQPFKCDNPTEMLRLLLGVSGYWSIPYNKESILQFERICEHDDGHLCEHRLNWLIEFIELNYTPK